MENFDHLNHSYKFEMSLYLNEGWELFKKGVGNFIGYTILYFLIVILASLLPLVNVFSNVIQAVLFAGYFIYCRKLISEEGTFNDLFGGFKFFSQIFLYAMVFFLFTIPIFILIFATILPVELIPELINGNIDDIEVFFEEWLLGIYENFDSLILSLLLIIALATFLYVSYSLTLPFIVDKGMSFWDAMETSRKTVGKNFFSFLIMYILIAVLTSLVSVLTCGLGILISVPYLHCVIFAAYDNITKGEENKGIEEG